MNSNLSPDAELKRDLERSWEQIFRRDLRRVTNNLMHMVIVTFVCLTGMAMFLLLQATIQDDISARLSALEQAQPAAQVEGE